MTTLGSGLESLLSRPLQPATEFRPQVPTHGQESGQAQAMQQSRGMEQTSSTASNDPQRVLYARMEQAFAQRLEMQGNVSLQPRIDSAAARFDVGEVANNVLDFVATAINGAKARGADDDKLSRMLEQAQQGIDQGFGEAKEALSAANLLSDGLEKRVDESYDMVGQGLSGFEEQLASGERLSFERFREMPDPADPAGRQVGAALYASHERSSSLSASMEFRTQEGDTVRLSFNESSFERREVGGSYARDAGGEGGMAFSLAAAGRASEFSVEIEGDLSAAERDALQDVFKDVSAMSDQFFGESPQRAFDMARELGYDDSQIAGFAINLSRSETQVQTQAASAYSQVQDNGGGRPQLGQMLSGLSQYARDLQGAERGAQGFGEPRALVDQAAANMNQLQAGLLGMPAAQVESMTERMQGLNELLRTAMNG